MTSSHSDECSVSSAPGRWAVAMTFNARKSSGDLVQQLRLCIVDGVDEDQALGRAYRDGLETVDSEAELAIAVARNLSTNASEESDSD